MISNMDKPIFELDITKDDLVMFEDDDESGVYVTSDGEFECLVLGHLKIKMTAEQEERLRFYYQNT